jgi:hypothetical protein
MPDARPAIDAIRRRFDAIRRRFPDARGLRAAVAGRAGGGRSQEREEARKAG